MIQIVDKHWQARGTAFLKSTGRRPQQWDGTVLEWCGHRICFLENPRALRIGSARFSPESHIHAWARENFAIYAFCVPARDYHRARGAGSARYSRIYLHTHAWVPDSITVYTRGIRENHRARGDGFARISRVCVGPRASRDLCDVRFDPPKLS